MHEITRPMNARVTTVSERLSHPTGESRQAAARPESVAASFESYRSVDVLPGAYSDDRFSPLSPFIATPAHGR
jgi:hypothetical protein